MAEEGRTGEGLPDSRARPGAREPERSDPGAASPRSRAGAAGTARPGRHQSLSPPSSSPGRPKDPTATRFRFFFCFREVGGRDGEGGGGGSDSAVLGDVGSGDA